jgi:hypothetical protein
VDALQADLHGELVRAAAWGVGQRG